MCSSTRSATISACRTTTWRPSRRRPADALAHAGMVGEQQRGGADAPALRRHEDAAALAGLEGQRRPRVVDEAADLVLEGLAVAPEPDIHESGPAAVEVPYHPGILLAVRHPAEEFADEAGAVRDRRAGRPVFQELVFAALLDPP